jgi:hypothetical protein
MASRLLSPAPPKRMPSNPTEAAVLLSGCVDLLDALVVNPPAAVLSGRTMKAPQVAWKHHPSARTPCPLVSPRCMATLCFFGNWPAGRIVLRWSGCVLVSTRVQTPNTRGHGKGGSSFTCEVPQEVQLSAQ